MVHAKYGILANYFSKHLSHVELMLIIIGSIINEKIKQS